MPNTGLDAEKLRLLQQWAAGLQSDERVEVAAAGRAILMLVEEVERLHVLIWDRRLYPQGVPEQPDDGDANDQGDDFSLTLRQRLRLRFETSFSQRP